MLSHGIFSLSFSVYVEQCNDNNYYMLSGCARWVVQFFFFTNNRYYYAAPKQESNDELKQTTVICFGYKECVIYIYIYIL